MINLVSTLFAAAPFGAGLVCAAQTGHDMRLLWMALASFVGATAVVPVGKRDTQRPSALRARSAGAFLIPTLLAQRRVWNLAVSGHLKFAHVYFTKPHDNSGLVVSASFSNEVDE